MTELTPSADGAGLRAAIVAARYNGFVTEPLARGAAQCLRERGVADEDIVTAWVPGALEVPAVVARMARVPRDRVAGTGFDVIVAVGCVIRGDTDHYEHVCRAAVEGVAAVASQARVAVGNAILTVHAAAQARERSGPGETNKGREAALAALEVADLFRRIG